MNDDLVRDYVHRHADAMAANDMEVALGDLSDELQAEMAQADATAVQPAFDHAEVLSIDHGDDASVAVIRYSGDGAPTTTVRSTWGVIDEVPRITKVEML